MDRLLPDGAIAKDRWSEEGVLIVSSAGGEARTNVIEFRNGVALLSVDTFGRSELRVSVQTSDQSAERVVRIAGPDESVAGGTLSGSTTTWSGVVRVTNDVTVPAGHTLRIEPGTLVLIDGEAVGTSAPDLLVSGTVESLGTETEPVWLTSIGAGTNWGQIRHASGSRGVYRHTFIHKGGRTAGEGHTGTGPVLRLSGADVRLEKCVVSDLWTDRAIGKGMYAVNSELVLDGTVFAQMRMGPEIQGTGLLCTNSYFMEMRGPDDCDGIYLHDSGGKSLRVVDSVFIGGDDDGIDTLSADVIVTNCIFRGWLNENEDAKAISIFNGVVDVEHCLIADCFSGISAKTASGNSSRVRIGQSTLVTKTNGVSAAWKSNAPGPDIRIDVVNSIVIGNPAVFSAFGASNVVVSHSIVSNDWAGTNVIHADPLFVDAAANDYHLSAASPAINLGDPALPDSDGSRRDAGYFAFEAVLATAALEDGTLTLSASGTAAGQVIVTEGSSDLKTWTEVARATATAPSYSLSRSLDANTPYQFFRFRFE